MKEIENEKLHLVQWNNKNFLKMHNDYQQLMYHLKELVYPDITI